MAKVYIVASKDLEGSFVNIFGVFETKLGAEKFSEISGLTGKRMVILERNFFSDNYVDNFSLAYNKPFEKN